MSELEIFFARGWGGGNPDNVQDTLTQTMYSISIVISSVIFSSSEKKGKMTPCATCRVPLRVSAPTVIPVCDYWNRSKTEVLSPQDGRTQIQGQTNISSATAADNHSTTFKANFHFHLEQLRWLHWLPPQSACQSLESHRCCSLSAAHKERGMKMRTHHSDKTGTPTFFSVRTHR